VQLNLCHRTDPTSFFITEFACISSEQLHPPYVLDDCISASGRRLCKLKATDFPQRKLKHLQWLLVKLFINFCMTHNGLKMMINSISNDTIISSKMKDCKQCAEHLLLVKTQEPLYKRTSGRRHISLLLKPFLSSTKYSSLLNIQKVILPVKCCKNDL